MSFSLADFQQILRNIGQERVAMLAGKYPDVVEPFLPKIEKRLREKGLIKDSTPTHVTHVTGTAHRSEMNIADLAADYKARGMDHTTAWGEFVKDRNLKPEISAKQFYAIYDSVSASRIGPKTTTVEFKPTHFDTVTEQKVMISRKGGGFHLVWERGMVGGEPGETLPARYQPIGAASRKDPDLYLSLVGDPAGKSWSVIYRGEAKSALAPMETAAAAYDRLHYEIYKRKVPDDAPVWDGNRGVFTTFNAVFGDAPKALTDKDAWTQLANLVPVALASYPDTVRTALERAFRSEASRA